MQEIIVIPRIISIEIIKQGRKRGGDNYDQN